MGKPQPKWCTRLLTSSGSWAYSHLALSATLLFQHQLVSQQPSSPRQCQRLWRVTWCTPAPTQSCTPPRRRWLMGGWQCSTPSPRPPPPCRFPTPRRRTQVLSLKMCMRHFSVTTQTFEFAGHTCSTFFFFLSLQAPSLRCSSQHLQERSRSQSQRCSYTQYGKICILQVKLSYSLPN